MTSSHVQVKLRKIVDNTYTIVIGSNLGEKLIAFCQKISSERCLIITDSKVNLLYGKSLKTKLEKKHQRVDLLFFPSGEHSKNQITKTRLEEKMLRLKCNRNTLVIALGGGVVGDLAGFVASTYMRGVPLIQVPTTLLAMVDSSVGGKTGIDSQYGKNLLGAFLQPRAVFADIDYLATLSKRQLTNGLAEVIKIFLTGNKKMLEYVEDNLAKALAGNKNILEKIILEAVRMKAGVVVRDEREQNERKILNFGHTIGHAVEHLSKYKLLHGEAVAFGILVESKISELMGILSVSDFDTISSLISELGINFGQLSKFKISDIIKLTQIDKKARAKKAKYVLLSGIGKVYIKNNEFAHEVDAKIIRQALNELKNNY